MSATRGNEKQAFGDVNNLLRQELLRRSISQPDRSVYLTLTPGGHRFLLGRNGQGADENQVFYHGFVKTRETEHDAAIYQLYQKEAENIIASGGKVTRVILDFELKKSLNRKLARLSSLPEDEQAERKSEVANEHGLTVVKGRIQIPDLRLEYEDRDHNPAKVDLELATGHYRHASLGCQEQCRIQDLRLRQRRSEAAPSNGRPGNHAGDFFAMNAKPEHIATIQRFGYTETEATFLYLVATHSGYFTRSQFLRYTQQSKGCLVHRFTTKTLTQGHATAKEYGYQTLGFSSLLAPDLRRDRQGQPAKSAAVVKGAYPNPATDS